MWILCMAVPLEQKVYLNYIRARKKVDKEALGCCIKAQVSPVGIRYVGVMFFWFSIFYVSEICLQICVALANQ